MKFLILGCNGMAGHIISLYLKEQGHDVTGYARSQSKYVKTIIGDACDFSLLKKIIFEGNYDSIINCIGLLNQFAEENVANAILMNSYLPHFLSQVTQDTSTQVIQMSTDCVFSGEKGQYIERDFKDGKTIYDRTKALGELENDKDITLRNSIVGPDIKKSGIGLMNWFMQQNGPINGFTRAMWTGQTTLQLAKTMEAASISRAYGLYNMVPSVNISKYELLQLFNKYLRNNSVIINPIEGIAADKSLKRTNFDFNYEVPSYDVMVSELADWMKNHKELYPHYDL